MCASRPTAASRRQLLILLGVAVVFKLGMLIAVADNPFVLGLTNDESFHVQEAVSIAEGGLLRDDAFYFAPLYPYLLAGVFAVCGQRIWVVLAIQALLGAVNVVVVMMLAQRALGSRRAAWIAAAGTLLFGPYLMYEALVLKTTVAVLVSNLALLLLLLALATPSPTRWFGCGLLFGVLTLLRGNVLLVLPFVVCGLLLGPDRRHVSASSLGLWLLGVGCGILPATVHNAVVALDFVPTTYQGGTNFYIGNHRGANGTYQSLRPGRGHPTQEKYDAVTIAEHATGRPLWPSEVSSFWFRRGFEDVARNPVAWVGLMVKKTALFHSNAEITDTVEFSVFRELEPELWLAPLPFGLILGLAVPGVWFARRLPHAQLLWLILAGSALSVIVFFVFGRYRVPVVSLYLLFAAVAVDRIIDFARSRSWRPLVATGATAAAVFGLTLLPADEANPAMAYNTLGGMYARLGDLENARHYLELVVREVPEQPELRHNLGNVLTRLGDPCGAADQHGLAAAHLVRRAEADPIVRLQAFEVTTAQIQALERCGVDDQRMAPAIEQQRRLARALIEDADQGLLSLTPEIRQSLAAAANQP